VQQWKYNHSAILNLIVIVNVFAIFHAMYSLVMFVVFTVLCILCMEVCELLCVTWHEVCDSHMLTTLKLGRRPPHPTQCTMAIHRKCAQVDEVHT